MGKKSPVGSASKVSIVSTSDSPFAIPESDSPFAMPDSSSPMDHSLGEGDNMKPLSKSTRTRTKSPVESATKFKRDNKSPVESVTRQTRRRGKSPAESASKPTRSKSPVEPAAKPTQSKSPAESANRRQTRKRSPPVSNIDHEPVPRRRTRNASKEEHASIDESVEEPDEAVPQKRVTRNKRKVSPAKAVVENSPVKRPTRRRGKKEAVAVVEEEQEEEEEETEQVVQAMEEENVSAAQDDENTTKIAEPMKPVAKQVSKQPKKKRSRRLAPTASLKSGSTLFSAFMDKPNFAVPKLRNDKR